MTIRKYRDMSDNPSLHELPNTVVVGYAKFVQEMLNTSKHIAILECEREENLFHVRDNGYPHGIRHGSSKGVQSLFHVRDKRIVTTNIPHIKMLI